MGDARTTGTIELRPDQLCTPPKATKPWWGRIICLLINHVELAAAGKADAYCKLCKKMLRYNKNTGNLSDHVNSLHKEALDEMLGGGGGQKQGIAQYCEQVPHFELQAVRWMVHTYQPISAVEQTTYKDMIAAANPSVRVPSGRNVAARLADLEEKARDSIKGSLKQLFLAITADAWSSPVMDSYLSVTATGLDESFKLISLPLECSPFPGSHTAERIYEKLQQLLARNGIDEDYVSAIVADNAANQKRAGELAPYDSLGCAPHTLQLTVKLVLEDPLCAALLKKCRRIVGSFKHSALKVQELKAEQMRLKGTTRRVLQDVKTRWSSTFMSIDMLCDSQMAIHVVCARHADPDGGKRKKAKAPLPAPAAAAAMPVAAGASKRSSAVSATAAKAATTARAVTRLFSGAATQLAPGALADADTDSSDSDDYYSSSDDGGSDIDYETPGPPDPQPAVTEVVEVLDDHSVSSDDSVGASSSDSSDAMSDSNAVKPKKRKSSSNSSSKVKGKRSSSSKGSSSTSKGSSKGGSSSKSSSSKSSSTKGSSSKGSSRGGSGNASKRAKKGGSAADAVMAKKKPKQSKADRFMVALTTEEWNLLKLVRDLLQPFHEAQKALEGEQYITRSWLPYYINDISKHLQEFIDQNEGDLSTAATALLADLTERWQEWPRATRIAVALDPRTKYMSCFDKDVRDAAWCDVVGEMKALYLQQRAKTAAAAQSDSSGDQEQSALLPTAAVAAATAAAHTSRFADVDLSVDPDADDDETFDDSITDADMVLLSQRIESEKKCFRSKSEPALLSGNPCEWWRDRAVAYPLLSVVARKWLAVPASSAASERMFSSAGLTVNKKRTSLKPELVATLVFLKTAWPSLEAQGVLYGRDSKCKQSTNK
jgi:hypothetical protein